MSERSLQDIGWPTVEGLVGSEQFLVNITIGQELICGISIPTLDIKPDTDLTKLAKEYFQKTNSPFIAYKLGAGGYCSVQLNPDVLSVEEIKYKSIDYFYSRVPTTSTISGKEVYQPHFLINKGDSINIKGSLKATQQTYSASFISAN